MNKWLAHAMRFTAVVMAIMVAVTPWLAAAHHDRNHIQVSITDSGFNGKADELAIEVELGQMIELSFLWAHTGYMKEEHNIVLNGYNVETDKLNSNKREATLKFIADKPGTFNFKCDLECDLHDYLQRGYIKVKAGAGGGGSVAARTVTALTLSPSTPVAAGGETVTLMVTLKDPQGAPVPKADVRFFVDATYGGTKAKMDIGIARTDANGVAFLDYRSTTPDAEVGITARFDGMGIYAESEQKIQLPKVGVPPPSYTPEPPGLELIRGAAPFALFGIVFGVWVIFAFVVFQVVGIFKERAKK
jgi:plastocyanin